MRKLLFGLLVICSITSYAQVYNNEWIDYSKNYHKFKIAKDSLYRIPQTVLNTAGLSTTPAEYFQLWRNGVQVPIYVTKASGVLSSSDYIEFWGQMNDGKPDKELYRNPAYQLNDRWSLTTDTATYFLTVNPNVAQNLRLQPTANNVSGTSLAVEPYFMYTAGMYFKDRINNGYAENVGENLYSSSYDKGEGWASNDISTSYSNISGFTYASNTTTLNNLFPYSGGPAAKFKIAVSGNSFNDRRYGVRINTDSIVGNYISQLNYSVDSANFNAALLNSGSANVVVTNFTQCSPAQPCPIIDRMVVHKYEITYARQFNFGGAKNFQFNLQASSTGNNLQITGFNYGSTAPVLYDLTNGKRYVADISAAPLIKVVLEPSATERRLILVSEDATNVATVDGMISRTFVNYNTPTNRGDYLIITNQALTNGGSTNAIEDYRAYRSSVAGGSYNAKTHYSEDLIDQFGFGINKNPAGLRNFIRYARKTYSPAPRYVFIIGKGVNYVDQRRIELTGTATDKENIAKLNLVPTFGWPASDVLLAAEPGSSVPEIPIGRLSAINSQEVAMYLKKMKEYELAQKTFSPRLEDRLWMKNVVHIVGASDEGLDALLSGYMDTYRRIIEDTLFGAKVSSFRKTSTQTGQQLSSADLTRLFQEGISLITYFGHSSASTLDFNLDDPQNYNNPGKYPLFLGLGCNAGDFFKYNPIRFTQKETISEKYVLSPDRGTIGFVASTHFGIITSLDQWNYRAYVRISRTDYGNTIGEIMRKTILDVYNPVSDNYLNRTNSEQTELHGDPALTLNTHPKPDYIIEDPQVKISPAFISVADPSFKVQVKMFNAGKAINRDIVVETKRVSATGVETFSRRDIIKGIRYADSISFDVPIDALRDKGTSKITVKVDADNVVDEMYETNNTVTKDVMVYEEDARPIFPYNFGIINKQGIKLSASTADPMAKSKQYRMEMDTTELFNSPFKITKNITSTGGLLEFDPGISFTDSTVYYWRVAVVPATGSITNWNNSSFIYLANSDPGFNQSHLYQHLKSTRERIDIDSTSRLWKYNNITQNIFVRHGTWVSSISQEQGLSVAINFNDYIRNACAFQSVVFNVFDPITLKPMRNQNSGTPTTGMYGSWPICLESRNWNFEYRYTDSTNRRKARDFMQNVIPDGAFVVVRSFELDPNRFSPSDYPQVFADQWKQDQSVYGVGNTLYDQLKNAGLTNIDSFSRPRQFVLVYKKNDPSFQPRVIFTDGTEDNKTLSVDVVTQDTIGYVTSPVFGPSKGWKELRWRGSAMEQSSKDDPVISVIGIRSNGAVDTVIKRIDLTQQNVDISSISAATYPYLQLRLKNVDTLKSTPYQLRYWRLTYVPVPEGAIAPNLYFNRKDSLAIGEPLDFKIAFKNVSQAPFDSLKVKLIITDKSNVQHTLPTFKVKPLAAGDTVNISYPVDTRLYTGANSMFIEVNPDSDQLEQFHFNNFLLTAFSVQPDTLNPVLDVTFDNVRILNHDLVSSKPNIIINLKDESKFLITDPNTMKVQVRYPNGQMKTFNFNSDTLQFVPANATPGNQNTATAIFKPVFQQDGEYELIITGKDMSSNTAGNMEYRVFFNVVNKASISSMLNYPNPFTTSTAFVFTITGNEVPQDFKIQILTVTGKVVREITRAELGNLHIGRNITDFKWDGTDQYGQQLGNGVYLYRVVTSLNGQSLEKYRDKEDNTDKYFNKGYGKMYLMR